MQKCLFLCFIILFLQASTQAPIPKSESLAEMEVSYYNAQLELLGKDEVHLNIKVPANDFSKVLDLFRGAEKSSAQSWDNQLVEVGTVLYKDRESRYYHRICVFQRFDKFASQFFSLDGKMFSVEMDTNIEQNILKLILNIERK